jgi:glycosyltransferase involved in cell wall biosynthesis
VGWLKRPIAAYLRKFHNRADLTLVPTRALCGELAEQGIARVDVVSRGVDTALFDPARRSASCGAAGGWRRMTWPWFTWGIAPEKNLALLEKAFEAIRARQPRARLVLVGSGPAAQACRRVQPRPCSPAAAGAFLAEHYASGDLFLFPSLTETYGNVVAEALASGLPVVAYRDAAARADRTPGAWLAGRARRRGRLRGRCRGPRRGT